MKRGSFINVLCNLDLRAFDLILVLSTAYTAMIRTKFLIICPEPISKKKVLAAEVVEDVAACCCCPHNN
jgi:hypothetical protein